jgi:tetratricopeptide (TPR) repeat protein
VLEAAERDPDPDALLTVRAQALAHLGRTEEAVAAAQRALRLSPDNPQVHYESALVFALLGDDASALWNARRALAGGIDRRWFGFSWFDAPPPLDGPVSTGRDRRSPVNSPVPPPVSRGLLMMVNRTPSRGRA